MMLPFPIAHWSESGPPTDPNFANVVLLLHFDGADTSEVFTDSSSKGHDFAGSVSGQLDTEFKKWGTASLISNGLVSPTVTSTDWQFGTADFTVEWWQLHDADGSIITWQPRDSNPPYGFAIVLRATAAPEFAIYDTWAANGRLFAGGTANGAGQWNHASLNRSAGVWIGTFNGVVLSQSNFGGDGIPASRDYTYTGCKLGNFYDDAASNNGLVGSVDELRITKGVARYTGAHAVPTGPFQDQ